MLRIFEHAREMMASRFDPQTGRWDSECNGLRMNRRSAAWYRHPRVIPIHRQGCLRRFKSRLRTDLHLSTLRRSIEAMGGELILTAKFPDEAPVKLTGFRELDT